MFCKKCGKAIPDESKICPECGEPVKNNLDYLKVNFKMKSLIATKTIPLIGICFGIVLIFVGLCTSVPSNNINTLNITKYVGGDAYNIMIEASLRGGMIAGRIISKSIYISVGSLITFLSAFKYFKD